MIPWYAIGIVGVAGLLTLLCGVSAHVFDREDGERRIITGLGALGAALMLTVTNAVHGYGQIVGWW